ncbi:MAG: YifB family Mg chelatase-like AAA ATPase [Gammaproteobacteria bacterium]|nr:YifB family Mg chelatase-like AAA ATPase [Gammaproteobacteria bacterium]
MTVAVTQSRASIGIHAPMVTVETHISKGLPGFHIVGLPETAVKESKERVRSAIITSHFEFPSRRITINLAPADLPKQGGRYDLSIALGILAASRQIPPDKLCDYEFAGELALSGELRPIKGILPLAIGTKNAGRSLILPFENAAEAHLIKGIKLFPARHLLDVCSHFLERTILTPHPALPYSAPQISYHDLKEVRGQHHAKRALEIAAAGQHSLLLVGPPGVGKTMLSNCLPGLLPPMSEEEAIELAAIQSISGMSINSTNWAKRPFRAPHHSASCYALIGGGNPAKPGEISLAHHGVLFLDELPEFKRQALEALREPLEAGSISISRANFQVQYPAKFQLIAAMNPCPCGQYGNHNADCVCLPESIKKYQARISGPLMDRIDIQAELQLLPSSLFINHVNETTSSQIVAERVRCAREIQTQRTGKPNALLRNKEIENFCGLSQQDEVFIERYMQQQKISARAYYKILKIARTIADLEPSPLIKGEHLKEAFSYRVLKNYQKI